MKNVPNTILVFEFYTHPYLFFFSRITMMEIETLTLPSLLRLTPANIVTVLQDYWTHIHTYNTKKNEIIGLEHTHKIIEEG